MAGRLFLQVSSLRRFNVIKTLQLNANNSHDVDFAKEIILRGGLVAVPTETVYGLAANAMNPDAVRAIFTAKGRPSTHPLIVHIESPAKLSEWAINIPPVAYQLAECFWPGPLTLLLNKANHVPDVVTAGLDTIGLRVPAHPALLDLLKDLNLGVAAPSANPYKRLSPTTAAQVYAQLAGKIDAVLDGGDCTVGLESTILDLTGPNLRILRAGPITSSQIARCTGLEVFQPVQHNIAVPGNVAVHYQPHTPLFLGTRPQLIEARAEKGDRVACLYFGSTPDGSTPDDSVRQGILAMPEDKERFARQLYKTLYSLDGLGLEAIWLEHPPRAEEWSDVNDRLSRAATPL
jgi:L-threonylcarbamoyladenylate synthase